MRNVKGMKSLLCMLMGVMIPTFILSYYAGNTVAYAAITEQEQEYANESTAEISKILYNPEKKELEVCTFTLSQGTEIQAAENEGFSKNVKTVKTEEETTYATATIKGIKPGKTYYLRTRVYMDSNDKQDLDNM